MLTSSQSAGVATDVNLRSHKQESTQKGIHPGFETWGRGHQKKIQNRVSVASQKDSCPPKLKKRLEIDFIIKCISI